MTRPLSTIECFVVRPPSTVERALHVACFAQDMLGPELAFLFEKTIKLCNETLSSHKSQIKHFDMSHNSGGQLFSTTCSSPKTERHKMATTEALGPL